MTGVDEASLADFHELGAYTGTSSVESKNLMGFGPSALDRYGPNITLGANAEVPQKVRTPLAENGKPVSGRLDRSLLERANAIIDSFNAEDVMDSTINMESLRGIVLQLWESAANATQFHQEILAMLESAILSVECLSKSQLSAWREAVIDLGNDILAQAHLDVIRRRFIAEGFTPLALLSEAENDDDCD
jgi:hypothetical protein